MAQISNKTLATLCRRLSIALTAGIDARTTLAREADLAPYETRAALRALADGAAQGQGIGDAVAASKIAFPALFRELVLLGDKTGKLPEVFARLADHYEHQVRLRRLFLAGILWPLIQLAAAVLIVGFLIWVTGAIAQMNGGQAYDILGWGLTGNRGLAIYCVIIAAIGAALYALKRMLTSEAVWTGPMQLFLFRLPVIGPALSNVALARLTWTLGMALETGMDVKAALGMGLRSTHSAVYTSHIPAVGRRIDARETIHDALGACGVISAELLNSIEVAELSGQLPETLLRLSDEYQDRARAALAAVAVVGGFLVWGIVALLVVSILVSIVSGYGRLINDLTKP